jgi:hypothetical protein
MREVVEGWARDTNYPEIPCRECNRIFIDGHDKDCSRYAGLLTDEHCPLCKAELGKEHGLFYEKPCVFWALSNPDTVDNFDITDFTQEK